MSPPPVCYVHLLRFPLQRRVRETPSLAGKPLVLWEEDRGVRRVAFAASAAQRAGVRAGMTLTAASALLPEVVPLPFVAPHERQALASLGEALLCLGPRFQLCPPDGLWLDAAAAHLFGGPEGLGRRLLALCAAQGYRAQVAVAQELFTARALARHGADSLLCVEEGESAQALRVLPLGALEGAAPGLLAPLSGLGLKTLGEVAALPSGAMLARFGAEGLRVHRLCRGGDDTPLVPEPLAELLEESLALDWPAESQEPLLFALKTLLDRLCARLFGRGLAAVRLRFVLRLDSRQEVTVPLTLARPSAQPRLLLELGRHRLADLTLQSPVAGVGVQVDEACEDPGQQLALGDTPEGDAPLEVVLSRLSSTLGEEALFSAGLQASHRPEAAHARTAFRPPTREKGLLGELGPKPPGRAASGGAPPKRRRGGRTPADSGGVEGGGDEAPDRHAPPPQERPARLFTRPATLEAELDEEGELLAARLVGRRRKVVALAGPERLAGEAWEREERAFTRDYYRVHFEGLGPVWIYRDANDGRFYLQGMFD